MSRFLHAGGVCLLLIAGGASAGRAQQVPPAPSSPGASQAAQAQNSDQNSSAVPANSSTSQKKVWTNEDIGELRGDSSISTFQPKKKNGGSNSNGDSANARGRDANWYRQQITNLQGKIPPIDAKIAELQKGVNGETVNDPKSSSRPYAGVRAGSWQQQMDDLQTRRADIVAKIGALEDQARHAGVPPGDIP